METRRRVRGFALWLLADLRCNDPLHHIGIGRTHVLLLIHDRHIRVIDEHAGELLRELALDPSRDYQPQARP